MRRTCSAALARAALRAADRALAFSLWTRSTLTGSGGNAARQPSDTSSCFVHLVRQAIYPIRVGRATTSLAAVDAFYAAAFPSAARVVETATRHCYKFENASTVDVCYSAHADDAEAPLSVADFEKGVRAGHDANLRHKPKCGRDKWLDFHFAYDNPSHGDAAGGDAVVAYADAAPDALYACEANPRPSGPRGLILHYVVDPTGWGIQYGGPYTTAPKACANATLGGAPFGDVYNPACDLGTC